MAGHTFHTYRQKYTEGRQNIQGHVFSLYLISTGIKITYLSHTAQVTSQHTYKADFSKADASKMYGTCMKELNCAKKKIRFSC
jgi:hypothetical protein